MDLYLSAVVCCACNVVITLKVFESGGSIVIGLVPL